MAGGDTGGLSSGGLVVPGQARPAEPATPSPQPPTGAPFLFPLPETTPSAPSPTTFAAEMSENDIEELWADGLEGETKLTFRNAYANTVIVRWTNGLTETRSMLNKRLWRERRFWDFYSAVSLYRDKRKGSVLRAMVAIAPHYPPLDLKPGERGESSESLSEADLSDGAHVVQQVADIHRRDGKDPTGSRLGPIVERAGNLGRPLPADYLVADDSPQPQPLPASKMKRKESASTSEAAQTSMPPPLRPDVDSVTIDWGSFAGRRRASAASVVDWVFENLTNPAPDVASAPSGGAVSLLIWARQSWANTGEFIRLYIGRRVPARSANDSESTDAGSGDLAGLCDKLLELAGKSRSE